ncbi:MAG: lipocalin family protein [Gramella sp.]|nr:lipocalin family protein [Christiangramia sp.]MBT8319571.1 lipocalin family protein [Christiangramia sp.]
MLVIFFVTSCSKNESTLEVLDLSMKSFQGTWKLTDVYISPGGETTWQSIEDGTVYNFNSDGTFQSSENECSDGTFELDLDSDKLTLNCENEAAGSNYYYIQELTASEMEISYVGCVEACIYRYRKQ